MLTIVGIMLVLAMPGFGTWTRDARVRTVSEEIANGLRLAQAEAVARNRQVAFVRTIGNPARNSTPSRDRLELVRPGAAARTPKRPVTPTSRPSYVSGGSFTANDGATISGSAVACFNSVGRVVSRTADIPGRLQCTAPTSATDPNDFNVTLSGSSSPPRDRDARRAVPRRPHAAVQANAAATQPNACTP